MHFDASVDAHSEPSLAFLHSAGIDFPRHRAEGITPAALGVRLASSSVVGLHRQTPWWLTFSGAYDLGYLLKLLTMGRPLPCEAEGFQRALQVYCPRRHELREQLPMGSLENLGRLHGVRRHGRAHTAGSDALLTLELFLLLAHAGDVTYDQDKAWDPWAGTAWGSWGSYYCVWEDCQPSWETSCSSMMPGHPWCYATAASVPQLGTGMPGINAFAMQGPGAAAAQGDATREGLAQRHAWHAVGGMAATVQGLGVVGR